MLHEQDSIFLFSVKNKVEVIVQQAEGNDSDRSPELEAI